MAVIADDGEGGGDTGGTTGGGGGSTGGATVAQVDVEINNSDQSGVVAYRSTVRSFNGTVDATTSEIFQVPLGDPLRIEANPNPGYWAYGFDIITDDPVVYTQWSRTLYNRDNPFFSVDATCEYIADIGVEISIDEVYTDGSKLYAGANGTSELTIGGFYITTQPDLYYFIYNGTIPTSAQIIQCPSTPVPQTYPVFNVAITSLDGLFTSTPSTEVCQRILDTELERYDSGESVTLYSDGARLYWTATGYTNTGTSTELEVGKYYVMTGENKCYYFQYNSNGTNLQITPYSFCQSCQDALSTPDTGNTGSGPGTSTTGGGGGTANTGNTTDTDVDL